MRIIRSAVLCAAVAGAAVFGTAGAAAVPAYHPSRLTHIADSAQVIVVTGRSKTSSCRQRFPAMAARTGSRGWVPGARQVQNTGTTPQGTYRITTAFGLAADPGTRLPYRHADANDYWVGDPRDPRTYNLVGKA